VLKSSRNGQLTKENAPPKGLAQSWKCPTQASRRLEWTTRERELAATRLVPLAYGPYSRDIDDVEHKRH
jgi:hypothetical protein